MLFRNDGLIAEAEVPFSDAPNLDVGFPGI